MTNYMATGTPENRQSLISNDTPLRTPPQTRPVPFKAAMAARVNRIPYRLSRQELENPTEFVNDDPVVNTRDAATLLGLTVDRLEKWRPRGQGPDYLRYDDGQIRYELSALVQFKAAHRVRPSSQPRLGRSSSR